MSCPRGRRSAGPLIRSQGPQEDAVGPVSRARVRIGVWGRGDGREPPRSGTRSTIKGLGGVAAGLRLPGERGAPSVPQQAHRRRPRAGVSGRLRQEGEEDAVGLREERRDECRLAEATDSLPGRAASRVRYGQCAACSVEGAPAPSAGPVTDSGAAARPAAGRPSRRSVHADVTRPVMRVALVVTDGIPGAAERLSMGFKNVPPFRGDPVSAEGVGGL